MKTDQFSWNIIATGHILPGFVKTDVVLKLQLVLKCSEEQAQKLVGACENTIKKGIDNTTANKYKVVLEKIGLEIKIQENQFTQAPSKLVIKPKKILSLMPIDDEKVTSAPLQIKNSSTTFNSINNKETDSTQKKATFSSKTNNAKKKSRTSKNELPIWQQPVFKVAAVLIIIFIIIPLYIFRGNGLRDVGGTPEADAQIEALRAARKLPYLKMAEFKQLLEWEDFLELDRQLSELNNKIYSNIKWELPFKYSIQQVSSDNKFNIALLDAWVERTGSAYAYLVRCNYYMEAGYDARGADFAKNTTHEQFARQLYFHKKALEDLELAFAINDHILLSYGYFIGLAMTRSLDINAEHYYRDAISKFPGSYYFRLMYLKLKMPKWGGSYSSMKRVIDETQPYLNLNPRLWLLQGFIAAEKGSRLMNRRTGQSCVDQYDVALKFGLNANWLSHRAGCLADIEQFDKALEDVDVALAYGENGYAVVMKNYLKRRM